MEENIKTAVENKTKAEARGSTNWIIFEISENRAANLVL